VLNARKNFLFSLADQSLVSIANFLTVSLGALFLSLDQQGALVYVLTGYIGTVLLNVATCFSTANVVRHRIESDGEYRASLFLLQVGIALVASISIVALIAAFSEALSWNISVSESLALLGFLFTQQLFDFVRRANYVFGSVSDSVKQSLFVYGGRILLIFLIEPNTIEVMLMVLLVPSALFLFVVLLKALAAGVSYRFEKGQLRQILRVHLRATRWNMLNIPGTWITLHLPVALVGFFHSIEAAAIVGTLRSLTTFANVFLELMETFVPAWMASRHHQSPSLLGQTTRSLLLFGAIVWVCGALLLAVIGALTVEVLFGAEYLQHSDLLLWFWVANGLYFVGRSFSVHFRVKSDSRFEFLSSSGGVVALVLSIPLLTEFGALGAAWMLIIIQVATLMTQGGYALRSRNAM